MAQTEPRYVPHTWDVGSLEYGGLWIKDCGWYADIIEVWDADSGEGLDGHVRVITATVSLAPSQRDSICAIRDALLSRGQTFADLREIEDRADRRREMWSSLYSFMGGEHESDVLLRTDKAQRLRHNAETVNGTAGLRHYLRQHHGLHFDRKGQPK